ncbi:hypothetical protein ACLK1T_02470 [Escherichia coli]
MLIADEPTTALDVALQARNPAINQSIAKRDVDGHLYSLTIWRGGRRIFQSALVMYEGEAVKRVSSNRFSCTATSYTRALLAAVPQLGAMKRVEIIPDVSVDIA